MLGEGRGQERNLMEFMTLRTDEGRDDAGEGRGHEGKLREF